MGATDKALRCRLTAALLGAAGAVGRNGGAEGPLGR